MCEGIPLGLQSSAAPMEATCVSSDSLDAITLESASGNTSNVTVPTLHSSDDSTMEEDRDCSLEDTREVQTVDEFMNKGCSCKLGVQGSPCSQQLSRETIEWTRQNCLELTKSELDPIVLSQIHSLQNATPTRNRSMFYIYGVQICFDTYLYLHCVSRKRYQNLVQHYKIHGLSPRIHGNAKRLPVNSLPKDYVQYKSIHY